MTQRVIDEVRPLLVRAVLLVAAYGVAGALGWRDYTSVLCGTAPGEGLPWYAGSLLGCSYAILHFAVWLFVPVLVLASAILAAWPRADTR